MAIKEIYRLGVKVEVDGVEESQKKLSAMERYTQQTEKRMKALNKITASPTAKIKDSASSAIDKINSKTKSLSRAAISPTAKLNDQATSKLNQISTTIKRLDNTNITANLRINDQASTYLNEVQAKADKLKNTNINPTAKIEAEGHNGLDSNSISDDTESKSKKVGEQVDKSGNTLSDLGDELIKKVTIPLAGVGIAASKIGMDFDAQMSRVKAISGATGLEFTKLKDQALQLGADTAFSAKQAAEGMENLASAGFSTSEIMTAMPGMLDLAASSGEDLASSADIASSTLRGFGLAADQAGHVADVLAKNAGATNAAVKDTGEAMKYIAPVAQEAGWSLESVAAAIGEMANSGIKGSSSGTSLRSMFSSLVKPSKEAAEAMESMGFSAYGADGKMKSLSTLITDLDKSTASMTTQQRENTIATLFGQEAMSGILTLIKNGASGLDDLTNSYKNSNGAAKEMATTMQDNAKSSIEQMIGSLETAGIKLEETFAPKIRDAANYVQDLANKFSELSPQQQDFYIKLALGAAALGPATKLVGTLTSGAGKLISVLGRLSGAGAATGLLGTIAPLLPVILPIAAALGTIGVAAISNKKLMSESCTKAVEDLDPLEKIMNKLNGNINKSKSELIKAELVYDDFGDGVSDSFKKAAQDASKSLLKIEMNIKRLSLDDAMDETDANQFKNYVNDFAYEGINAMREQQSKIQAEFQKTFSLDGVTSNAEQGVMDYLSSYFEEGVNKELGIRDEIYKIGEQAIKDHGAILDGDMQQIKEKLAQLQAIKLEYANAENAGERAYARSKFTSSAERVTGVDGASELLQDRVKEHNNTIDETNANYSKTIAATQSLMDNESDSDKKAILKKGLDEVTAARDKALTQAEEDWQSDLATLYGAYPKAKGKLNEKTGAKFSDEDIKRNQTLGTMTNSKFAGLTDVKENGMYSLINNDTGKFESVYAEVDKVTGEVTGAYAQCSGYIGGYTAEMAESAKKSALEISNSNFQITSSLDTVKSASVNAAGEMIGDGDRLISKLGALQTAQDGTLYRTMSINGTPINVQVDSTGAILNLDEVRIKADEASKGRSVEITSNTTEETTKANELKAAFGEVPPNTNAHLISNALEVTSEVNGTTSAINQMPPSKTITITTIFKKITQWFDEKFDRASKVINDHSTASSYTPTEQDTYDENRTSLGGDGYATGTSNATRGYHDTAENGYEILVGREKRWFNGGEKVLNHQQSKAFLENQQNNEPFQVVKQDQYQLAQPQQVQVAGVGGNNVQVDVQVNGGNQDIEGLIVEVTQEVGRKLKEALSNIKK